MLPRGLGRQAVSVLLIIHMLTIISHYVIALYTCNGTIVCMVLCVDGIVLLMCCCMSTHIILTTMMIMIMVSVLMCV